MNDTRLIDLHSHSYYSDGTFSPEGLVILAKKQGLSALALTDHDTIDGLELFLSAGKKHGMETIAGIEFAALWEHYHRPEIHILGLGINPSAPKLTEQMATLRRSRDLRNHKMAEKLTAIGLPLSYEEVAKNAGGEIITRAHFANVLLQKGFVKSRAEAFSRYISPGLPGYIPREILSPALCIQTIKEAGGIAVLAHPTLYSCSEEQLEELCEELLLLGLDGIECLYSTYTPAQTKMIEKLAKKYTLLPSGGSDFHGENKPDIQLGVGKGNLKIPYAFWENLKTQTK